MAQCSAIKQSGGRCERIVGAELQYCFSHDPARAGERKRNAARGGRAKSAGEISHVKASLQALADATLSGKIDPRVGAVVSQIWNSYLSALRTELKVREAAEFESRLENLERIVS